MRAKIVLLLLFSLKLVVGSPLLRRQDGSSSSSVESSSTTDGPSETLTSDPSAAATSDGSSSATESSTGTESTADPSSTTEDSPSPTESSSGEINDNFGSNDSVNIGTIEDQHTQVRLTLWNNLSSSEKLALVKGENTTHEPDQCESTGFTPARIIVGRQVCVNLPASKALVITALDDDLAGQNCMLRTWSEMGCEGVSLSPVGPLDMEKYGFSNCIEALNPSNGTFDMYFRSAILACGDDEGAFTGGTGEGGDLSSTINPTSTSEGGDPMSTSASEGGDPTSITGDGVSQTTDASSSTTETASSSTETGSNTSSSTETTSSTGAPEETTSSASESSSLTTDASSSTGSSEPSATSSS